MGHTINFRTFSQVILFECEIKGQLSDGHWENARPHTHWIVPCAATARVATKPELIGASFYPTRKYNFAARELLEIVADRMIGFVKVYTAFPELPFSEHWTVDFEGNTPADVVKRIREWLTKPATEYYHKQAVKVLKLFNTDIDGLSSKLEQVFNVQYTMTDLRKDLKEMSKTVQTFNRLIPR